MIESTQKKLREALFFCAWLERECRTPTANQSEAAEFYLSAFLSAARSVTFALRSEEKEKYDAWFPTWLQSRSEEDTRLFDLFKTQRNRALKRGAPDVAPERALVPVTKARYSSTPFPAHILWWGDSVPEIGVRMLKFRPLVDGREAEVAPTCRRYVGLLEQLVRDFLHAHPPDAGSLTSA